MPPSVLSSCVTAPLLAERIDAHRFERVEPGGGVDRGEQVGLGVWSRSVVIMSSVDRGRCSGSADNEKGAGGLPPTPLAVAVA